MKIRTLAAVAVAVVLAACGTADHADVVLTEPASYGEAGHCYYVDDIDEVAALQAAGHCPVNWVAWPMPSPWRSQYAWYYDSPRYYDRYVPVSRRTTYVTHVKVYEQRNPQAVRTAPKAAQQVNTRPQGQPGGFSAGSRRPGGDAATSRTSTAPRYKSAPSSGRSGGFSSGKRR